MSSEGETEPRFMDPLLLRYFVLEKSLEFAATHLQAVALPGVKIIDSLAVLKAEAKCARCSRREGNNASRSVQGIFGIRMASHAVVASSILVDQDTIECSSHSFIHENQELSRSVGEGLGAHDLARVVIACRNVAEEGNVALLMPLLSRERQGDGRTRDQTRFRLSARGV